MSPSKFLLSKAHSCNNISILESGVTSVWKPGHPKYLSFKVGDEVTRKTVKKGNLNINKFQPNYFGPLRVTKVNSNGVTCNLIVTWRAEVLGSTHRPSSI